LRRRVTSPAFFIARKVQQAATKNSFPAFLELHIEVMFGVSLDLDEISKKHRRGEARNSGNFSRVQFQPDAENPKSSLIQRI
jgi:hypothetical protein